MLTVVTLATYWTVNEMASDVEDPFLYGEPLTTSGRVGVSDVKGTPEPSLGLWESDP